MRTVRDVVAKLEAVSAAAFAAAAAAAVDTASLPALALALALGRAGGIRVVRSPDETVGQMSTAADEFKALVARRLSRAFAGGAADVVARLTKAVQCRQDGRGEFILSVAALHRALGPSITVTSAQVIQCLRQFTAEENGLDDDAEWISDAELVAGGQTIRIMPLRERMVRTIVNRVLSAPTTAAAAGSALDGSSSGGCTVHVALPHLCTDWKPTQLRELLYAQVLADCLSFQGHAVRVVGRISGCMSLEAALMLDAFRTAPSSLCGIQDQATTNGTSPLFQWLEQQSATTDASRIASAIGTLRRWQDADPDVCAVWAALAQQWADLGIRRLAPFGVHLRVVCEPWDASAKRSLSAMLDRLVDAGIAAHDRDTGVIDIDMTQDAGLGKAVLLHRPVAMSAALPENQGSPPLIASDLAMDLCRTLEPADTSSQLFFVYNLRHCGRRFDQLAEIIDMLNKQRGLIDEHNLTRATFVPVGDVCPDVRSPSIGTLQDCLAAIDAGADEEGQKMARSRVTVQLLQRRRTARAVLGTAETSKVEDNAGPYIQYTHARLCGIERSVQMDANLVADEEARVPSDQESLRLALDLDRVAEIVAAATLEPSLLVRHVIGIAREASSLYYSLRVKDIPPDIAVGRMRFWRAVRIVLQQLMLLLAVHPLAEDEY